MSLRLTDWKRWIATLCVVLVAFVVVERTFCADTCGPYNITQSIAAADISDAQGDMPIAPTPAASHHCNSAHTPVAPITHQSALVVQTATIAGAPYASGPALTYLQSGPERPPRLSAIV